MSKYRILVMVGSIRKGSFNRMLAQALTHSNAPELVFSRAEIGDLPLYSQDDDADQHPVVRQLKSEISAAAGVLFVTPEYNRSIPGVLKNAIDHASRPYGQNAFAGKPAGILGASPGILGTSMAQQHLRNVLAYLDMATLSQPEVFIQVTEDLFDAKGDIARADIRELLRYWLERYGAWVAKFAGQATT
jgi:chromate reductase, NAD(P)H dehydrogenase (quinone)